VRLKYQLFLSLLLCGVALIALLALINSWSFDRGFTRFVVESERRRLALVIEELAELYQEHNGWSWIDSKPQRLKELQLLSQPIQNRRRSEPSGSRNPRESDRRTLDNPLRARNLILVDADKNLLVGNRQLPSRLFWEPIEVGFTAVGYLGIRQPRSIPDGVDNLFIRQQLRTNALAAVALVILSALMAIALASRLVKPILKINNAVGEISGGNYRHQITDDSRSELGSLSKNINQLASTLDKNQNARQQWTAEISHELRTPVAVLQGELEAMQDGIKPIDRHAIDSLHSETLRLSSLISDLHALSLSDIGALDYQMVSVDLNELVDQRLAAASTNIENSALSVSFTPTKKASKVRGDEKRLGQLIDNLIQNSLRYTNAGGKLNITLAEVSGNKTQSIELRWCDSEPGVSDAQLTQLFEPLYRTDDSRNRASGGAGLGLSIVKKIAEAHNATLSAHHAAQGGLEVRLNFPLEEVG